MGNVVRFNRRTFNSKWPYAFFGRANTAKQLAKRNGLPMINSEANFELFCMCAYFEKIVTFLVSLHHFVHRFPGMRIALNAVLTSGQA